MGRISGKGERGNKKNAREIMGKLEDEEEWQEMKGKII
jgi:hypothetical protein